MKIQYDFQKLKGKMVAYYGTQGNFAKELGMSKQSLSRKLHNEIRFTYEEIGTDTKRFNEETLIPAYQIIRDIVERNKDIFMEIS